MSDVFRVSRFDLPADARCIIEVDDYVPLRFRTHDRPLGSSYVRLGDQAGSLLELLVDPNLGLLRGITITSLTGFAPWPSMQVGAAVHGLPVLEPSWNGKNRINAEVDFSVAVRGSDVLVYWALLDRCEVATFAERVDFLTVDARLAAVMFANLMAEEIEKITAFGVRRNLGRP